MTAETTSQMLARVIHDKGGRILVVGGGVAELPPIYQEHPALLFWDDNQQGFLQKEIPSNVRAILWSRWISHAAAGRLNVAVRKLHIIKFPMLRTREIKELLADVVHTTPELQQPPTEDTPQIESAAEELPMVKKVAEKAPIKSFVAKHIKIDTDWTQLGARAREGERLFAKAIAEGIKTTQNSMIQAVYGAIKELGKPTTVRRKGASTASDTIVVKKPRPSKGKDDFEQLEELISDAITAMKLVQEHLPKVRKETERLRGLREKMLKMLGIEAA